MGEIGAFLKIHRVGFDKRDPQARVHDYNQYFRLQPESELRDLVAEHAARTGSPVARRLLAGWDAQVRRFLKVMPGDYKRALAERAAAEAEQAWRQPGVPA